ncbi:zinc finger CCCH domain-containing protein 18 [Condylostylus longicornis]|uniref:zinc finger CCCH domain-containing protein 18 n=1 Tax=Condylostylus longicornis TaxID=2530218 RepID=UPI00244DD931|nr:zinc finger CCCH domain-containing protein 18 [Condylostylus longicornis]
MESEESTPGISGSASDSSNDCEDYRNSSGTPNRFVFDSNNDAKQQSESAKNSPNSTPNTEHDDTRSNSQRSRSSTPLSSSENGDDQMDEEPKFDHQRSQSVNSAASNVLSGDGDVSGVREYSASPDNSRCSSNLSHESREIESEMKECGDFEKSYEEKEDGSININHEELSNVSETENDKKEESDMPIQINLQNCEISNNSSVEQEAYNKEKETICKESNRKETNMVDLRQKLDAKKNVIKNSEVCLESSENICKIDDFKMKNKTAENIDDLAKKHDEDALDFEAEEGECQEISKDNNEVDAKTDQNNAKINLRKEKEDGEELEEGEVSDEDEKRPEESEPKPVCRFYTRGACTWGMSCRFLHPGVTDKGNYTMFDMIRPVPIASNSVHSNNYPPYIEYQERSTLLHRPPHMHHPNFSNLHTEHRMMGSAPPGANPSIENIPAVESAWERGLRTAKEMMRKADKRKEQYMDFEDKKMNLTVSSDELEKENFYMRDRASPEPNSLYTSRTSPAVYGYDAGVYSPPHRIPLRIPGANTFEEVDSYGRSSRYRELPQHRMPQYKDERRVRPTREVIVERIEPSGRGNEWSDPWMRSKTLGGRDRDKRSSLRRERSYSSNSSYSSSSSSRSASSSDTSRSLSVNTRRRRYDSSKHNSYKSPGRHIKTKIRTPSPSLKRRRSSSSSDSSGSESDSSYSSSSSSSSRGKTPIKKSSGRVSEKIVAEKKLTKKSEMSKKRSPISIELKKTSNLGASSLSAAMDRDNSNSNSSSMANSTKKITRREELLKQLRAVEDAIARKKSKLS